MNLIQTFRRLGQQMTFWKDSYAVLMAQIPLITKLYAKNGLEIKLTCGACPEQYDIFKDGELIGYYRLRHGEFRVDYYDKTIYEGAPNGDGTFDTDERLIYLTKAMRAILNELEK